MRLNSVTVKLLAIIASAFVVTTIGVLVLADIQLKRILDKSQETVYTERIDTIISILDRSNQRLEKTGLVEAYAHDFKQSARTFIRNSYYDQASSSIYPFILNAEGLVVIHPKLPPGDHSLKTTFITRQVLSAHEGDFEAVHQGQTTWYRYRRFDQWGWVIVYAVPLEIKYRDAHIFRNTLVGTMSGVTVLVLAMLILIVRRFTRPIVRLTEASRQIADGNLGYQIDARGDDEVGILARAFVSMRDAIQRQIANLNQEIAERKMAEKALQESEAHLSEAQKLAGLGYWTWNIRTGAVDWSAEMYRIFKLNPSEFTPQIDSIMKLSPWPEYNQRHEEIVEQLVETNSKGEHDRKFLRSDGSIGYYHSTFRGNYDENGNLASVNGTVLDITERKIRESELKQLRNYLSNIIDSMPSMLVGVDAKGTVTQWNREAEKITGHTAGDVVGKPLDRILPHFSAEMPRIRQAIQTRREATESKRRRKNDNRVVFEDVTIYPLIADGVEGAVIRIDDVTERVHMEEMMIQSEKMLSVGGLAAGMAHEINNPLAGMIQTARVMANRLSRTSTIKANLRAAESIGTSMEVIGAFMEARNIPTMIDTIVESGQRVADIVSNMLTFARKSDSRISRQSLTDLIDKTLELAATDYDLKKQYDFKRIEVVKQYADNLPSVPCESAKIQQVLLNLFRNGAQAMQEKTIRDPQFIIRVHLEKGPRMICIEIEDNGPGMDEATRKRVFEPFFTTKPSGVGTGLGLSVSYFIIAENHNGLMNVESSPGKGTTFFIRLPVAGTPADE